MIKGKLSNMPFLEENNDPGRLISDVLPHRTRCVNPGLAKQTFGVMQHFFPEERNNA